MFFFFLLLAKFVIYALLVTNVCLTELFLQVVQSQKLNWTAESRIDTSAPESIGTRSASVRRSRSRGRSENDLRMTASAAAAPRNALKSSSGSEAVTVTSPGN